MVMTINKMMEYKGMVEVFVLINLDDRKLTD